MAYRVDILSEAQLTEYQEVLLRISKALESKELKDFLANKILITLNNICEMNFPIENENPNIKEKYMSGIGYEIKYEDDCIIVYNDSVINIEEKNMKPTTKARYPAQLSLAKIVEYGIGIVGSQSMYANLAEDWEYDVRNHGSNGWFYKDDNGNIVWTDGFRGRFIFYKLVENVKEFASQWIEEYIEKYID